MNHYKFLIFLLFGFLFNNSIANNSKPIDIAAGGYHTCVLLSDGQVKCWGGIFYESLGINTEYNVGDHPNEMGGSLRSVNLGYGVRVIDIDGTAHHTCAILSDRTLKCWGNNSNGQLGQCDYLTRGYIPEYMGDSLKSIDLGQNNRAYSIATGYANTCAILDGNGAKCWGSNSSYQLGYGVGKSRGVDKGDMGDNLPIINFGNGRTAADIDIGYEHMCALLDNGEVKCWGRNMSGELGLGHDSYVVEMGDNLKSVDLGKKKKAKAIAVGNGHTCAILTDGYVKCWGKNVYGSLGTGDSNHVGDDPDEMGDNLLTVDLGKNKRAVAIGAGDNFTCVLMDDGSVKCWGDNRSGQLGQGHNERLGNDPQEMGDQLKNVDLGKNRRAKFIKVGFQHACAILDDDSLKCWGSNGTGALGQGDNNNRGDEPNEMGDNLKPIDLG